MLAANAPPCPTIHPIRGMPGGQRTPTVSRNGHNAAPDAQGLAADHSVSGSRVAGRAPAGHPSLQPGLAVEGHRRGHHARRARDPRGDGLHEDRGHAGDHRPLHDPDPHRAFALLGSSRHLVVGGDSATAAIMYAGIAGSRDPGAASPTRPQWLAFAGLSALLARRIPVHRPRRAARLPRRLHLADRARRFPDRRRHPGRDGPGRRDARRPAAAATVCDRERHGRKFVRHAVGGRPDARGRPRSSPSP